MTNIKDIQSKNPSLEIHSTDESLFNEFATVIENYDNSSVSKIMSKISLPTDSYYKISDPDIEADLEIQKLGREVYAGMPFVAGECVGNASDLPSSEYHNGSEINIFQNDVVMALGRRNTITNHQYNPSKKAKLFFIPANTAIEIYGGTLHFAPFKVDPKGFKFVVMLLAGTNETLAKSTKFTNPRIAKTNNFFFDYEDGSMIGNKLELKF